MGRGGGLEYPEKASDTQSLQRAPRAVSLRVTSTIGVTEQIMTDVTASS